MKLFITTTPQRARTIWRVNGCETDVACAVDQQAITLAGVDPQTSKPTFEYSRKLLRTVIEHARLADDVLMCQPDTPAGHWHALMLGQYLSTVVPGLVVKRAVLHNVNEKPASTPLASYQKQADVHEHFLVSDFVLQQHTQKPLKKAGVVVHHLGDRELQLLLIIAEAVAADDARLTHNHVNDSCNPDVLSVACDRAGSFAPDRTYQDILLLADMGVLAVGRDHTTEKLIAEYRQQNFDSARKILTESVSRLVLPTNPAMNVGELPPQYRELWLDIWPRCVLPDARSIKGLDLEAEVHHVLCCDEDLDALANLRADSLVRGWSYLRPTDLGNMVVTAVHGRQTVLTSLMKGFEVKIPVAHLCDCRGELSVAVDRGRARLVCGACGAHYAPEWHPRAGYVARLLPHTTYHWCRRCGIQQHDVSVDHAIPSLIMQRCKGCGNQHID